MAVTSLSQRLRWLRRQSGLTLAQVAARAFISVSHLSDMERGAVLPSLPVLERIAHVYGLSIGECLVNVSLSVVEETER